MPLMSIFKRAVVENCIHNNLARLCVLYLPKPWLCRNVNKVDLLSTPVKTMFKTLSLSATFLYRSTQRTFKALRCPIFQPMAKCPNRNPCIINVVCLCTITHVSDVLHVTALMSASVRTYTDISDVVYKYEYGRVISIQNCRRIMKQFENIKFVVDSRSTCVHMSESNSRSSSFIQYFVETYLSLHGTWS